MTKPVTGDLQWDDDQTVVVLVRRDNAPSEVPDSDRAPTSQEGAHHPRRTAYQSAKRIAAPVATSDSRVVVK